MKYEFLFIDLDDTIYDFQASAKISLDKASEDMGLPEEKRNYTLYSTINQKLWDDYSLGKTTKEKLVVDRFEEYFNAIGFINVSAVDFGKRYEKYLSETAMILENSDEILKSLKNKGIKIYIITNGIEKVQRKKIKICGIDKICDGIFISDEIGSTKPDKRFFEYILRELPFVDKKRSLIVGDNLLSDIGLGINAGVDTCYLNRTDKKIKGEFSPTYEIFSLKELLNLI